MASETSFNAFYQLQRLGQGNCGSVWGTLNLHGHPTVQRMDVVIKREDGSPGMDIKREAYFQSQVFNISSSLTLACVPQCIALIGRDNDKWRQLLPMLPAGLRECRAMIAEKINPVSTKAQLLLVDKYNWAPNRDELMKSLADGNPQHCLVHLYLGRPRDVPPGQLGLPVAPFFSLRDFHLHVDQAEELQLPYQAYAGAMAEALATLHWKVGIDGAGIKFVLGARRGAGEDADAPLARHVVWMLDFDYVTHIQGQSDLQTIARAFWRNEPYFPRPNSSCDRDRQLWDIFAAEYRRVGMQAVLDGAHWGQNGNALCNLVDEALRTIVKTKGRWVAGGYF